ncbi:MAG: endonuclease [Chloroflexi bacterium]|nr:endonuclease [Chloroflexota bacterium]
MTVYLLHFERPIGNPNNPRGMARHYLGSAKSVKRRLAEHRDGNGARIMQVLAEQGVNWELARTWPGGRAEERRLKARHNAPRLCPICRERQATRTRR